VSTDDADGASQAVAPRWTERNKILVEVAFDHYGIDTDDPNRFEWLAATLFSDPSVATAFAGIVLAREARERRSLRRRCAGAPRKAGRPHKRANKYSAQQLEALSRAAERFERTSEREDREYDDDTNKVAAFLRSLPPAVRNRLPADLKPETVRKIIRRGDRLRANPRGWRRAHGVDKALWTFPGIVGLRCAHPIDEAIWRRKLITLSPGVAAHIVRDLARLEPGTAIAERRLREFLSETVLLEYAARLALAVDYGMFRIVRPAAK
jgi:hypothetical protein